MKREILITIGIILLFLGGGVQPAISTDITKEVIKPKDLLWGIYRNCHISEEFGWYSIFPPLILRYCINFALLLIATGLYSCKLSGAKGNITVSNIIGFGFTGSIDWNPDPRESDTIEGDLLFCIYLK
jgi:hypothetical protein